MRWMGFWLISFVVWIWGQLTYKKGLQVNGKQVLQVNWGLLYCTCLSVWLSWPPSEERRITGSLVIGASNNNTIIDGRVHLYATLYVGRLAVGQRETEESARPANGCASIVARINSRLANIGSFAKTATTVWCSSCHKSNINIATDDRANLLLWFNNNIGNEN